MEIFGLDAQRAKSQQKTPQNTDESVKFSAVFGVKSSELLEKRVTAPEDIRKQALRQDKYLIEDGHNMDGEEVAEELLLKKKKKLAKKVEDVLRSQQQGLGL